MARVGRKAVSAGVIHEKYSSTNFLRRKLLCVNFTPEVKKKTKKKAFPIFTPLAKPSQNNSSHAKYTPQIFTRSKFTPPPKSYVPYKKKVMSLAEGFLQNG